MLKKLGTILACCAAAFGLMAALSGCDVPNILNKDQYTPESKAPTVAAPAIGQEGVLRVGVNTQNPPMAGQASKIVGIDVDLAAALADELGLKVEIADVGTDAMGALKNGDVDVVLGVDASDSNASMWKSSVYLPTAVALFASTETATPPTKGDSSKIAAQASSMSTFAVTNQFGAIALKECPDLKTAFASMNAGEAQFTAADAVIGSYASHTSDNPAFIIALLQQPTGYVAAVSSTNTELQTAVGNAITNLTSNGVMNLIQKKWLGATIDVSAIPLIAGASKTDAKLNQSKEDKADDKADDKSKDAKEEKKDEAKAEESEGAENGEASE